MKIQAWGWLAAAVMAAGLNASYHDGGMQWAHEIVDQVQHNSEAVLALATGRADQFLAEAQLVTAKTPSSCPFTALAQAESQFASQPEWKSGELEMISARQQAAFAKLAAKRAKMEVRLANMRIPAMNAMVVSTPRVSVCPRIRVNVPHINVPNLPMIEVPATPMVHVETQGAGPV